MASLNHDLPRLGNPKSDSLRSDDALVRCRQPKSLIAELKEGADRAFKLRQRDASCAGCCVGGVGRIRRWHIAHADRGFCLVIPGISPGTVLLIGMGIHGCRCLFNDTQKFWTFA